MATSLADVSAADGEPVGTEHGRPTTGTWYLDDDGTIVGPRFIEGDRGSRFDGRYR